MALAALFLYLMAAFGVYSMQGSMIYVPDDRALSDCELPAGTEFWAQDSEQGLVTAANNPKLMIFFHGNAGSACNWRYLGVNHLAQLGYDTLVVEYAGYGGDPREPSKREIEHAILAAHNWADGKYENVTVFGYSLGSGAASIYANQYGAEQVILFAPYDSVYNVALNQGFYFPRFILTENFDNIEMLAPLNIPVHIRHGEDDIVIPAHHSANLVKHLQNATRQTVAGVGHTGLFNSPEFDIYLQEILIDQ